MDSVIELIHEIMPALYVLALLALIVKIIMVFSNKGFDIIALLASFFRLYSRTDLDMTTKKKRVNYMRYNNYLNYYFYVFIFLFALMLIIFKKNIFTYQ
jgi:hypothetical protein